MPLKERLLQDVAQLLADHKVALKSTVRLKREFAEQAFAYNLSNLFDGVGGRPKIEVQLAYLKAGKPVIEVGVPDGDDPDEYCAAVQEYLGPAFQVEPWKEALD